ncbi:hypothetical protein GPX89_00225 [Nocardia sp. ET3-3]|uniref:Uncharacterized protein n=1 Tax=Nocardia terrae TaxID=2675851 RepID=A0A7K1UP34_9NOCA|nr:hypothetical protein [Nocardia terrae]MVU75668.1 hypothetical protein [Nocardia terrae]
MLQIPRDDGDIDPRRLGLVVLAAVLMTAGVGAGMLLTGSGDRPIADDSIVNVIRPRHDRAVPLVHPPNIAPAEQVPVPAEPNPAPPAVVNQVPPPAPAAPHPVEIPVVIGPGDTGPIDAPAPPPDIPAPQDDSAAVPG